MVEFEFKRCYKLQRATQQTTLDHFRIELLHVLRFSDSDLFDPLKSKALFEHPPEQLRDLWNKNMAASQEARDFGEMTTEEAAQVMTIGDSPESVRIVAEIPKSPHTLRPKKDKQPMVLVCMSPRNPLRTKLTMEEKGKVVNVEINEEEKDLEEILVEEEENEETKGMDLLTRLSAYAPLWKGKERVPKDLYESKSSL